jgi:hypothetical protein
VRDKGIGGIHGMGYNLGHLDEMEYGTGIGKIP